MNTNDETEDFVARRQQKNLKVGIVGNGFVGKAVDYAFTTPGVEKMIVDPKYTDTTLKDLCEWSPQIVFVCLPTPAKDDGSADTKLVQDTVFKLVNASEAFIVIKSTVPPDDIHRMCSIDTRIAYNPEFLTEGNSRMEFVNAPFKVIGVSDQGAAQYLEQMYAMASQCAPSPSVVCTPVEASLIKYSINSFLATKVTFFNELNNLCEKYGSSFLTVSRGVMADQRIGFSHTRVPGYDGKKGFGGACFPKDTIAFTKFAEANDAPLKVLATAIEVNNTIRAEYETSDREKESNVDYGQAKEEQQDQDDGSVVGE